MPYLSEIDSVTNRVVLHPVPHRSAGRRGFSLRIRLLALVVAVLAFGPMAVAQVSASLSGTVTDPSGAAVTSAAVVVRDMHTEVQRDTATDAAGRYQLLALPVGEYEISVKKQGFAEEIRRGIQLAVGQDAAVDLRLQVGEVSQQITVEADAPPVSVTTADISGLVGEHQVKDLPLNGRSFDELVTLNPGVVNFTTEKTGGIGVSNSTNGNNFAVSGNRPQQNLFLLNGVEYTGAAENNMQPGGTSGQLLGVDAVREFNVLRDSYGAEYGKRPGAQVSIVTQSGTNQWHGSAYEFLRNNDLDARNFFDVVSAPPFQRNQFGASLGGPIQTDKTFFFSNYEGLRQNLHQTSETFVPAADARNGTLVPLGSSCPAAQIAACAAVVTQLLDLWPLANGPELTLPNGNPSGIAALLSSPLQTIREDFGTTRMDHVFSANDMLSAAYTIDDGADMTATLADSYSTDLARLREQVLSLEETHVFSPSFVNTGRFGFSRAAYFFLGEPTPGTPASNVTSFVGPLPTGAVVVGGSTASNPATQLGLAGSNNGTNLNVFRNLFTYEDQVTLTRGRHQFSFGAWFQQFQSNEKLALSQYGQASFSSINALLGGVVGTLTYDPAPTQMNWRSLFAAWYAEDTIRVTPKLILSLGFRAESSTGWNEAHGRAANYFFTNGVINSAPHVGNSAFNVNNSKFLPEPRIGVAWSPFGNKTVVRAGFGMYNDLQDALGYRMDQNAPFNPTYGISSLPVANFPVPVSPVPSTAKLSPGGVQPDLKPPTLISYSLRLEEELSPNTSLTVGYIGSHGYHEIIGVDANEPAPVVCPTSPCPATFPANFGALTGAPVPAGTYYVPAACSASNATCNAALAGTWTWFGLGTSSYNALQLDLSPPLQPRPLAARNVHMVEGSRRWRFVERHHREQCPRPSLKPVQFAIGQGSRHLQRAERRSHQRHLRTALRARQSFCEFRGGLERSLDQRMVVEQRRHSPIRFSLHAPIELQPFAKWRHEKSRATLPQSGLHRTGCAWQAGRMVRSCSVHCSAQQQRLLRQFPKGHVDRAGACYVGFFGDEEYRPSRGIESAIPSRNVQSLESGKFQHAKSDFGCGAARLNDSASESRRGGDYEHLHNLPAGSVRVKASVVTVSADLSSIPRRFGA